jgi:hypothetical protein
VTIDTHVSYGYSVRARVAATPISSASPTAGPAAGDDDDGNLNFKKGDRSPTS